MNRQDILRAYEYRYATKDFDRNKKIPDEDFEIILETGRLSPSSFGWEPWKFVVVQNQEMRNKLIENSWGAQTKLPAASHFVLLLARTAKHTKADSSYVRYMAEEIQRLPEDLVELKLDLYRNFLENDFDLTDDRKLFDWASKQTYIPLANMMSSAAMIGVDSCAIEGFDREKVEAILREEGIIGEDDYGLSVMAAFGYRTADTFVPPKTRQPARTVIQWID